MSSFLGTLLTAVFAWSYASHRTNMIAVGGAVGDADFWIRLGDVGFCAAIFLWPACIAAAMGAVAKGWLSVKEGIAWISAAALSGPLLAFAMLEFIRSTVPAG